MTQEDLKKINSVLILSFATLAALYFAASLFIPLTFAAFLAALVTPLSNTLEKTGMGRTVSSLISTIIVFVVVAALSYLLFYQLKLFTNDLPTLKKEFESFYQNLQEKLATSTQITPEEQKELLRNHSDTIMNTLEGMATNALGGILFTSLNFLLVLVYLFLFLLYRNRFSDFIMKYVSPPKKDKAGEILYDSSKVIFHYLWGRIKVMAALAAMYFVTFLLFDVPYLILLTIFGALVTIIPYIGPLVSGILPVALFIVLGKGLSEILLFSSVVLVIQLIESYVLEPVIIGSEVQLNPLAVILAIIIGGMVWGIAGMIIFVPLLSILKIIFDRTNNLRPIGFLLGNTGSSPEKGAEKA